MGTLFRNIYSWLRSFYGDNLYNFLKGLDCDLQSGGPNRFLIIGLITLGIAALMCCLFYFVKRGRFNSFVSWIVVLAATAVFSFAYGFGHSYSLQNEMPAYVIYGIDNVQCVQEPCDCFTLIPYDDAQPQVTTTTFLLFGFANAIIAIGMFIILSIILKRFSTTAKHTPWKSLWPKQIKKNE